MTLSAYESATQDGQKVEIYTFYTNTNTWRQTSADEPIIHGGYTYEPANLSRSDRISTIEINKSSLEIYTPKDHVIASMFNGFPPGSVVGVTILQGHRNDPDQEFVPFWFGRILGRNNGKEKAVLSSESSATSQHRLGLSRKFQLGCPHALYGAKCGVNRTTHLLTATASSLSGPEITFASGVDVHGDNYFNGGLLYWDVGTSYREFRMIESQVGNVVTVTYNPATMTPGTVVSLYPGCDHTLGTCANKFTNVLNYGGWPFMPNLVPFNGTNIF